VINTNVPSIPHRFQIIAEVASLSPEAENRTIVSSFVWTNHWNVTDGQTDSQPVLLQRSVLRWTRCKALMFCYVQSLLVIHKLSNLTKCTNCTCFRHFALSFLLKVYKYLLFSRHFMDKLYVIIIQHIQSTVTDTSDTVSLASSMIQYRLPVYYSSFDRHF